MHHEHRQIIEILGSHFRVQPILCAKTYKIQSIEILSKSKLDFDNEDMMLRQDISTLHAASIFARILGRKVHFNAEIKSIIHSTWIDTLLKIRTKNLVVEVVERNTLLADYVVLAKVTEAVKIIKNAGIEVALDDVTATELDEMAIVFFAPSIIKVDNCKFLEKIKNRKGMQIVVEKIETAADARKIPYADFLQGYWCDNFVAQYFPSTLELPGVMFQKEKIRDTDKKEKSNSWSNLARFESK